MPKKLDKKEDSKIDELLSKLNQMLQENKELKNQVTDLSRKVDNNIKTSHKYQKQKQVLLHSIKKGAMQREDIDKDDILNSAVFEKTVDALLECQRRGVFDRGYRG